MTFSMVSPTTSISSRLPMPSPRYSQERGLGIGNLDDIDVVGETIENVMVPDFKLPGSAFATLRGIAPGFLLRFLQDKLTVNPWVNESSCTLCLAREKICPVSAVTVDDTTARIDHRVCIACMCCHEVCRFHAITPRRPAVGSAQYTFWLTYSGKSGHASLKIYLPPCNKSVGTGIKTCPPVLSRGKWGFQS